MTARVLVVDDEGNMRRMLRALLEEEGYEVYEAEGGLSAVGACETADPDVVLLDLVMAPGPGGLEVLDALAQARPGLPVVMMSGKATLAGAVRAIKLGAYQFLEKPLTPEAVLVTVKAALDLSRARAQARAAQREEEWGGIVGSGAGTEAVRRLISQVAPTTSRVLITGESGTGKELVARAIHAQGPRRDRALVALNCAAVPRDLVESELFGHERGAVTGAHQRRRGKFELADGGTLFLDEVGDLEPQAQAKLLRTLEGGVIERVGGDRPLTVDVRVIAATNKDLEREAEAGRFRADLLYRLNVFPIRVPPLRDRLDDIPALVEHFAARAGARCGRPARPFTPEALERFRQHPWPGNVRELANAIERLTIIGDGAALGAQADAVLWSGVKRPTVKHAVAGSLSAAMDAHERELIRSALEAAQGNVAEAARRLQTDRANLYRRMRRLGLRQNDTDVSE